MNFQKFSRKLIGFTILILPVLSINLAAQVRTQPTPTMVIGKPKAWTVARGNNLYCAGYIQTSSVNTSNKIVGGNDEADKYNYSQNDLVYLNMGASKGVKVGDTFAVIRPRGHISSKWSKKGDLGFYVQEVGAVEVISVKSEVAIAKIRTSCDNILLGDLVQTVPQRVSPAYEQRPPLDLFQDPSGKATGRIVMARDNAEAISRDFIAFVDLGVDSSVREGDHLTVFRKLGKGNLSPVPEVENIGSRDDGYHSDTYSGGKFSNQAGRKSGENATGSVVTTKSAKKDRPDNLRKVVGEAVVLNVKEKTATIVITRTVMEIHTGDWVEIQ